MICVALQGQDFLCQARSVFMLVSGVGQRAFRAPMPLPFTPGIVCVDLGSNESAVCGAGYDMSHSFNHTSTSAKAAAGISDGHCTEGAGGGKSRAADCNTGL